MRFAPALSLTRRLLEEGARVIGYDPVAVAGARLEVPEIEPAADAYDAAEGAHCLVLCTEWNEFLKLDLERLA